MSIDPTQYPYSAVVRITGTFGTTSYQASGVMISPDEVLTAGHVVYLQDSGNATNLQITPEASFSTQTDSESAPLGTFLGGTVHYIPLLDGDGTLTYDQSQSDYAVIHLTQPLPGLGTMGILPNFTGGQVNILGYPAVLGGNMDLSSEYVQLMPNYSLLQGFNFGTNVGPGSSGGPAFTGGLANPQIVGLVSTGGNGVENYTQITQQAYNQIEAWVQSDDGAPTKPTTPVATATPAQPTPQPVQPVDITTVLGTHAQYTVANSAGSLYLDDSVAGRNGTQTLPGVNQISFSDGVGRFDPAGGAGQVARIYLAAFDRPADISGLDFWTAQIDSHTLGIADVAADFITSAEFASHYGNPGDAAFVNALYQNVLGRQADAGGLINWEQQLATGTTRAQVLTDFSQSFENRYDTRSTIGDNDLSEATRLYQAAFNRAPDVSGLNNWTTQLDQGVSAQQVATQMSQTTEFAIDYAGLDTTGFVTKLYQNALHRAGDPAGIQNWVQQIQGGASRASVLLSFSDSIENKIATAGATHDAWVFVST